MGWRILRGWPLPAWVYPGIAVIMAALTFVVNRSLLQAEYSLWSEVSTAWHEGLFLPGGVLAALAAPVGAALSQKASPVSPGGRPREGVWLMLAHAGALGLWAVVGHAVGMVPAVARAVGGATWGALGWQDVVVGSSGVVLLTVVGYCLGALVRRWLLAPVVGLVVLIAMFAPDSPSTRPLGLFGPVRQFATGPRFELTLATTGFGVLAMICVGFAIAHVALWVRRRGAAYQGRTAPAAWVGAVVVLGVIAFTWRPELYMVDRPVPSACREAEGIEICLHAANEAAREQITSATIEVTEAGLGPLLTRVTDREAVGAIEPLPGEVLVDFYPGPFLPQEYIQSVREGAADRIAAGLTDERCPDDERVYGPDEVDPYNASASLKFRVLRLAGFNRLVASSGLGESEEGEFFATMNADELTTWVQQHKDQIESCTITVGPRQ